MSLFGRLSQSIQLDESKKSELARAIKSGSTFFNKFNDARMKLAFSSFAGDMKKALFEIIFFLHVNDAKYAEHSYPSKRIEVVNGVKKMVDYEAVSNLFLDGCPAGVVGIDNLSPIFKSEFATYIQEEFGETVSEGAINTPYLSIYSIASLGSIGTVGHKKLASDLDLQVQYELEPFLFNPAKITDVELRKYANEIIAFFSETYRVKKGYTRKDLSKSDLQSQVRKAGHANFKKRFPLAYEIIVHQKANTLDSVFKNLQSRQRFVHELIAMFKFRSLSSLRALRRKRDAMMKKRIGMIQDYIQKKFPKAEVYLFAYSNDNYRDGKHGTTMDSKEASGSAYEHILNYEVLMPGIQFTPMVPLHFLMPDNTNADRKQYEQLVDYIRFHTTELFDRQRAFLVDLGATPPITNETMVAHSGAIYWEAFKASSGNLPKALLNLLRIEMLFDTRFNTSIIELIKKPKKLDKYSGYIIPEEDEEEEDEEEEVYQDEEPFVEDLPSFYDNYGIAIEAAPALGQVEVEEEEDDDDDEEEDIIGKEESAGGLSLKKLFKLEDKFPLLLIDPWWLKYKALKIGFGPENKVIKEQDEKDDISRIIDLGFALHIKVSDVFLPAGKTRKFETHREKFMAAFLVKAFPRKKRGYLEHIFSGDVEDVIRFERELKSLFKNSMLRVHQLVEGLGGKDKSNQDEYRIWFHYYQANFDPPKNVVRRDILSHLKIARGRLQIGLNASNGRWFFKSIQKSNLTRSRYDTFGKLDHLPDIVELFEHDSFLHGVAHCILNGYYGVLYRGTLRETRTHLEFAVGNMKVGDRFSDQYAFVRPDIVIRLVDRIDHAFPPQEYDFRDVVYKKREVTNIFICLNLLWCGRLTFMYRDNRKNWYVDEIDHPELAANWPAVHDEPKLGLESPFILKTIRDFFKKQDFTLTTYNVRRVTFWVNPNSMKTFHSVNKFSQKEDYVAKAFKTAVTGAIGVKIVETPNPKLAGAGQASRQKPVTAGNTAGKTPAQMKQQPTSNPQSEPTADETA